MSNDASKKAANAYWNRRLQREPARPTLAQLIEELNERLRADPAYRPGTRFILHRNSVGQELPTWEGPAYARALIHRVLQSVTQRVTLPAPFLIDGVVSDTVAD